MWRCIALLFVSIVALSPSTHAWVKEDRLPFPDGHAPVILHQFCLSSDCGPFSQQDWHQMIRFAIGQWNNAGSNFRFTTRPSRPTDSPCNLPGEVAVIVTDRTVFCPGDTFPAHVSGATVHEYNAEEVRIYINANFFPRWVNDAARRRGTQRLLRHEFGHVVGLGHPDEAGQTVEAVMNSNVNIGADDLLPDDIAGIRALYGTSATERALQATLEAPANGQTLTGVGLLRGWACDAETVSVRIDGGAPIPVLVGSPRADTQPICGHTDTGFALLINWNNLGVGDHTLDLFINGRLHTSHTVTVITYGQPFITGMKGQWTLTDWPEPGTDTKIAWNEATQNIEIVDIDRLPQQQQVNPASCEGWSTSRWDGNYFEDVSTAWVRSCLTAGADPNARGPHGETPLHRVAWASEDNAEAVRLLIQYGANVNARSNSGVTPLHLAASWPDNFAIVVALLEAGADPNAKDNNGYTPLYYHDNYGLDSRIEQALLNAGADPNIPDD